MKTSFFDHKLEDCKSEMSNLISRLQFNNWRETTDSLYEKIRKRIADRKEGGKDFFYRDSKPVEVASQQVTNTINKMD